VVPNNSSINFQETPYEFNPNTILHMNDYNPPHPSLSPVKLASRLSGLGAFANGSRGSFTGDGFRCGCPTLTPPRAQAVRMQRMVFLATEGRDNHINHNVNDVNYLILKTCLDLDQI
jgi:hypothetical protein